MLNYSRLHLFGIEMFFLEFKGYMAFMESYIESSANDLENRYQQLDLNKYEKSDPEYHSHLIDSYSERWFEINRYYPHNFRASFLVQMFSVIEYELKKICDHYHIISKTDFSISDLKGSSDLEKAQLFLKKSCKIDFIDLQDDWNRINLMRKIRNRIVHHQSKISQQDKDWMVIKDYVLRHNDWIEFKENLNDVSDDGSLYYADKRKYAFTLIIKNKELNEEFINITERFFRNLLENKLKYS